MICRFSPYPLAQHPAEEGKNEEDYIIELSEKISGISIRHLYATKDFFQIASC
jgi:hypothetical protein